VPPARNDPKTTPSFSPQPQHSQCQHIKPIRAPTLPDCSLSIRSSTTLYKLLPNKRTIRGQRRAGRRLVIRGKHLSIATWPRLGQARQLAAAAPLVHLHAPSSTSPPTWHCHAASHIGHPATQAKPAASCLQGPRRLNTTHLLPHCISAAYGCTIKSVINQKAGTGTRAQPIGQAAAPQHSLPLQVMNMPAAWTCSGQESCQKVIDCFGSHFHILSWHKASLSHKHLTANIGSGSASYSYGSGLRPPHTWAAQTDQATQAQQAGHQTCSAAAWPAAALCPAV
jgi:hypothetical protein